MCDRTDMFNLLPEHMGETGHVPFGYMGARKVSCSKEI